MQISYYSERLNRGLGQLISARKQNSIKDVISLPENEGGLTDTMEDRDQIAVSLKRLLDQIEAANLGEFVMAIYVDFIKGDPTRFRSAEVLASKLPMVLVRGQKNYEVFSLGEVKRLILGTGYKFIPPGSKQFKMIENRVEMRDAINAEASDAAKQFGIEKLNHAKANYSPV